MPVPVPVEVDVAAAYVVEEAASSLVAVGGGDRDGDEESAIHVKWPVRPGTAREQPWKEAWSTLSPVSRPSNTTRPLCLWVLTFPSLSQSRAPDNLGKTGTKHRAVGAAECPKCPAKRNHYLLAKVVISSWLSSFST